MTSGEQELLVASKQTSSVYSSWELQLETIAEPFYGYGYGPTSGFYDLGTEIPELNYFNVIGLPGNFTGYGYDGAGSPSNITDFEPTYSYGWGYEYAGFLFTDNSDTVVVRARVLKDDIPQANIRVFFYGSPTILLNESSVITDANGYAQTLVSINKEISINQLDGWGDEVTKNRETPQVFRSISGSGSRTVSAMIFESPEIDDGNLTISSSSTQTVYSEVVFNLDVGTYAYAYDGEA